MPTVIDMGVASPSAHGQAMISTATAFVIAAANRGCGPNARPRDKGDRRNGHNRRHEHGRNAVGQFLHRCTTHLCLGDESHDLRQQCLIADMLGSHRERTGLVQRAARDAIAGTFGHGDRLTRHQRFVDGTRSIGHPAIDWNLVAGPHPQEIAGPNFFERNFLLNAMLDSPGRRGRQGQQFADGPARLPAGPQLENLSQKHENRDGGRRLEVEMTSRDVRAWRRFVARSVTML